MTTTYSKTLLSNSTAGAEHFGAISDSVTYRVLLYPFADNTTAAEVRSAVISTGHAGISAIPGRPLVVDSVIQYSAAMIVRTVQCATIADGSGTDITIGLTRYDWGSDHGGDGDVSIRLSTTVTAQAVQVYRGNPALPTNTDATTEFTDDEWVTNNNLNAPLGTVPTAASPDDGTYRPAGDIDGEYLDWNGNPISILLPAVGVSVEVLRRGAYVTNLGTVIADDFKPFEAMSYVGKRNNVAFAGFGIGELLCTGIERKVLDGEWTSVIFKCTSHAYRHAYQVPRPTFMTTMGTMTYQGDPRSIGHTRGVYWKQPYLEGADFAAFFTTLEQAYIVAATA